MGISRQRGLKNFLSNRFRRPIRFLFINSKFHFFFNDSIANVALKLVYLSKFSRWLHIHPCQEFNGENARYDLYQFLLETEGLQGEIDYLEFGVAAGVSLKWWVEKNKDPRSRFVGFDTFTGLPENWDNVLKGTFTVNRELPHMQDNRCVFEVGLFQDTLFGFLQRFTSKRRTVIHIDCDIYNSALFVLTSLAVKLKKGDILIFDEFGSIRHPTHEFRAFYDFLSAYKFNYKQLGAANFFYQVAVKLI